MLVIILNVRRKAARPVARNPSGKRLCRRSALLLDASVEQPRGAPHVAQPHDPTAVGNDERAAIDYAARNGRFATLDIIETASSFHAGA